jgi:MazG family protein
MPRPPEDTKSFSSLMQIVADLRSPDGCPWDRVQTHQSLAPFAIEEAYELAEILDHVSDDTPASNLGDSKPVESKGDSKPGDSKLVDSKLKDELGDLLFQVALHAQIAQERKAFTIEDVLQNLNQKMIRRHPHVFAESQVKNVEEVWTQWEKIKAAEKVRERAEHGQHERKSDGLTSRQSGEQNSHQTSSSKLMNKGIFDFPPTLPSLQRAYKIGTKAQKRKFDWNHLKDVQAKLTEELTEFQEAIESKNKSAMQDELGDVLFTIAQIARHLEIEPEQALRKSNHKFETRFESMLKLASVKDLAWESLSDPEKEALWNEIKTSHKN